jgi:hypothetical protein
MDIMDAEYVVVSRCRRSGARAVPRIVARVVLATSLMLLLTGAAMASISSAQSPTAAGYGETGVAGVTLRVPLPSPTTGSGDPTPGSSTRSSQKPLRSTRAAELGTTAAARPVALPVAAEPGSRGTLPFTGAHVALLALSALLLLCVGLTLRRATRATP